MVSFFFNGWEPVARIVVIGSLAYVTLILLLRIGGKRTLAQMNGFDFIITVALGASFGRMLTARQVSLLEAVTTFALLITLQYVFSLLQLRSRRFARVVTAEPRLLYFRGEVLHDALRRERIKETELHAAVRKQGYASVDDVAAVIIESDGKFAVIGDGDDRELADLRKVAA